MKIRIKETSKKGNIYFKVQVRRFLRWKTMSEVTSLEIAKQEIGALKAMDEYNNPKPEHPTPPLLHTAPRYTRRARRRLQSYQKRNLPSFSTPFSLVYPNSFFLSVIMSHIFPMAVEILKGVVYTGSRCSKREGLYGISELFPDLGPTQCIPQKPNSQHTGPAKSEKRNDPP